MFCYGIEASQLYHAEWIDSIRATTLGTRVGIRFLWSDVVAYTIGVGVEYCVRLFSEEIRIVKGYL